MPPIFYQNVVEILTSPWLYIGISLAVPLVGWLAGRSPALLALSAAGFRPWLRHQTNVWAVRAQLWFHARIPVLFAAALVLLAPLSWRSASGLLGNLFILDWPFQFAIVAFMSMVTSLMVLLTFRVTELNAQERFDDFHFARIRAFGLPTPPPPDAWSFRRIWLSFAFALPIPLSCLWHTYVDSYSSWHEVALSILCTILGLSIAWLVCKLAVHAETFWCPNKDPNPNAPDVLPFESLPSFVARRTAYLNGKIPDSSFARFVQACLGPGYATVELLPGQAWIRTGQRHNLLCGAITLGLYVVSYLAWRIYGSIPPGWFPPVFYILLLFLLLGFFLHALSFYLDRYRVPTLVFAALTSFAAFMCFHTDHYYELSPLTTPAAGWEHFAAYGWEIFGWTLLFCLGTLALLVGLAVGTTFYRTPAQPLPAFAGFKPWWAVFIVLPLAALLIAVAPGGSQAPKPLDPTRVKPLYLETVFEKNKEKKWKFGGKAANNHSGRTLVVVTAEGGGIQASAWATQVLTGLHKRYGKDFTKSIGLISGVSGGGVGAMYYLANWKADEADDDPLPGDACKHINELSQEACLEASAWGMTFPDFLRFGMPMMIPKAVDRGWALEESFRRNLRTLDKDEESKKQRDDWRLSDLQSRVAAGEMPVPVFNATLVETGQRFVISPVCRCRPPSDEPETPAEKSLAMDKKSTPVEFLRLFDDEDNNLRVSTAARLSAGFAYVSPVCCAQRTPGKNLTDPVEILKNAHVVDGGYVDNEGVFTVVDWVHFLMSQYARKQGAGRPFDRIVIIRIRSFPPWYSASSPGVNGWTNEFWGPMTALQSVRVASQAERNTKILELLGDADYLPTEKIDNPFSALDAKKGQWSGVHSLKEADALVNNASRFINKVPEAIEKIEQFNMPLNVVEFSFTPMTDKGSDKTYVTPLSWSLTKQQKDHICKAWDDLRNNKISPDEDKPLQKLDELFEKISTDSAKDCEPEK